LTPTSIFTLSVFKEKREKRKGRDTKKKTRAADVIFARNLSEILKIFTNSLSTC
jgi:hypothetical protein